jgi:Di-haem oxidoreductase, putative peroxidase
MALWGVGTTGLYGHDGRSHDLTTVILRHGGEAQRERDKFAALSKSDMEDVLEFLGSLILFGPLEPDSGQPRDAGLPAVRARRHRAGPPVQRSQRSGVAGADRSVRAGGPPSSGGDGGSRGDTVNSYARRMNRGDSRGPGSPGVRPAKGHERTETTP